MVAPDSGAAPGTLRLSRASGSERTQRPKPHSGCSERLSGDALWPRGSAGGRMIGPDGGAGAGCVLAPREMPSGARYRLYLRSRLTSAARVPRARAAPGDLARPLHPDSLIPLRYNTAPGPPHADFSLRSLGQLGAERGGWQVYHVLLWESGHPHHSGVWTPESRLHQHPP